MAHIFDVLSTINGQLNILAKDYMGQGKARHLNCAPDFVLMSINRAIDVNKELLIDSDKNASVEKPVLGSTGDHFNPVYLVVVSNIRSPIIDKVPVIVNYKEAHGPGTAYIVGVPKLLFEADTDDEMAAKILRDIYFPVLDMDKEMEFKASPATLIIHDQAGVNIKTYDLTMVLVAIGCIYVNLRNWYVTDSGKPISPSHLFEAFPEFDQYKAESVKEGIVLAFEKHGKNINEIRDAVASGKLVRVFMYKE